LPDREKILIAHQLLDYNDVPYHAVQKVVFEIARLILSLKRK
jgi:hypothetical protein